MSIALIGSTGFVGGNLVAQAKPDACFRSTDIAGIRGREFELLLCAGAPAVKWLANREPEADLANLRSLMGHLEHVRASRTVLFSTVDVFDPALGVDEDSPVPEKSHPYGAHRRLLERFFKDHFDTLVIRLPGLFGAGLKKNVIFDLMNNNRVEFIDPRCSFQYYDLSLLWADVQRAQDAGLKLVHFATEPINTALLADEVFGRTLTVPNPDAPVARYDLQSVHAATWGRTGPYLYGADEILQCMKAFVAASRSRD
jgi:dTDP-4-dehydrorhamnose reductase